MILEDATYKAFGYYPSDLLPKSRKPVLAACELCGKFRVVRKHNYRTFCISCIRKGNTNGLGYKHTEEAKAKISAADKGRKATEETKAILSAAKKGNTYRLGYKATEETRANMSAAMKGNTRCLGYRHTEEAKGNMSAAQKGKYLGENNPAWQGGISFLPYCIKFNKAYKRLIRNLFGNECFLCTKTTAENGRALDVHHVNYNKDCGCDGANCICVPLCMRCHMKTNYNRDYWQALIMEMLKPMEAWE